jgi:hypothetical protein
MADSTLVRLGSTAERRWGLVTTAQAEDAGVSRKQFARMASAGAIERVAQGVYRMARAPPQDREAINATWLLLVAILHFIPDAEDPAALLAAYREALPVGSFLVLSHGTSDFHPAEVTTSAISAYDSAPPRSSRAPGAAIEALLAGFTAEPPGLVQASLWHPDSKPKPKDLEKLGIYAAVAAKN